MSITVPQGFDIQAGEPIDLKLIKQSVVERDNISIVTRYDGLVVYVKDSGMNYQLRGGVDNINWESFIPDISLYYTKIELQTPGSSQVSWENITNIPLEYTPIAHSHAINDINEINVSSPIAGSVLQFDGTNWTEATLIDTTLWGGISGTLSNQLDLQTALDSKKNNFVENTAFNKDFGITFLSVAQGNHTHNFTSLTDTYSSFILNENKLNRINSVGTGIVPSKIIELDSGYVGIGIPLPDNILHLKTTVNGRGLSISGEGILSPGIYLHNSDAASSSTSLAQNILAASSGDGVQGTTAGDYVIINKKNYRLHLATNDKSQLILEDGKALSVASLANYETLVILDGDLTNKKYVDDSVTASKTSIWSLYQPDGTNPFVYTDNTGKLHIDGDIIQSGAIYVTNVEQVYSTKDTIIMRDGAIAGLGVGEYSGVVAKLYDGVNDGQLVFDKDGYARVGDIGSLQKLATIEEAPTDTEIMYYDLASLQLKSKVLSSVDISDLYNTAAAGLPSPDIDMSRVNDYYSETALIANATWGLINIKIDGAVSIDVNPGATYTISLVEAGLTFKGSVDATGLVQGLTASKSNLVVLWAQTSTVIWVTVTENQG